MMVKVKGYLKQHQVRILLMSSTLSVGDQTNDPTILIKETVLRGKTTISLKEFDDRPTGIVSNADGSSGVYYQDTSVIGLESRLVQQVYLRLRKPYTLSQLFADESKYKNDLNNDGNIGDVITAVIGDNGSIGLYQTGSGSYLIDNSGLGIGDSSVSPTLLMNRSKLLVVVRRRPVYMILVIRRPER